MIITMVTGHLRLTAEILKCHHQIFLMCPHESRVYRQKPFKEEMQSISMFKLVITLKC